MSAIVAKSTRNPKRVHAAVAAVGAAALLIGGGSTFALWSDTAEITGTFDNGVDLTAGHWEATIPLTADAINWFDASPDAVAYNWTGQTLTDPGTGWLGFPDFNPKVNEWEGNLGATGYTGSALTVTSNFGDYSVTPTQGYKIDPASFHVVPGDVLVGLFTMEDLDQAGVDVTNLVGQNLAVTLNAPDVSQAHVDADVTGALSQVLAATAIGVDHETIAIVVVYPSEATDYLGENSQTAQVGASISGITATITQQRPDAIKAS